ncbi:MAG: ADP-ribosylglycohydrolase family protein [Rugosibacter sp.]|nr:MAG: ADP-ribosylglycohydrolase family protein [Rugosibacter sp.]
MTPRLAAILGALTADAATLGLHWLYDAERLKTLQQRGPLVFRAPDPANYQGVMGYFAHAGKQVGDLSFYGESCRLMLAHLAKTGGNFERQVFQQEWLAAFGPGGHWVGYADRPTRLTVVRLLGYAKAEDYPAISGVDDDQLPALECVPAIVASQTTGHARSRDELLKTVQQAVAITHDHPQARDAANVAAIALDEVLAGTPLPYALSRAAQAAGEILQPLLTEALALPVLDSPAAAARFGMPCHLHQGLPLLFHIAHRASGFREAVEANILAGGDSCGRSLMLGALTAAHDAVRAQKGHSPGLGIPLAWLSQLNRIADIVNQAERITAA